MNACLKLNQLSSACAAGLFLSLSAWAELPVETPATASNPAPVAMETPKPAPAAPAVRLPYGVEDILKLSRAQIGDTVILNYIQNSGTIYTLEPEVIVHMRDQGVSERVINAMLEQKKNVLEAASGTGQNSATENAQPAPQPAVPPGYVYNPLPAPEPGPSTLHIIPYPSATRAYYTHYRPVGIRTYGAPYGGSYGWGPIYRGGYFGYGYGCGSSVVTIHSGFGSHSPTRRGR